MLHYILSNGIPLGIFLSFMIGPVFFTLLELSITKGFRAAVSFDLGVAVADIFFISVAYLGSYQLINRLKDDPAIYIFGGIIMMTYGLISFFKTKKAQKIDELNESLELFKKDYFTLLVKGFLLNFINIGVLGFWLLIIISFVPKLQSDTSNIIWFFVTVIGTYLLTDMCKIVLAKQLRRKLTIPIIYKIKLVSALLMIFFGLALFIQSKYPNNNNYVKKKFIEKID